MIRRAIILLSLSSILLVGCFSKPVEEIQQHEFTAGTSLQQAYGELLDNISWQKVKVDKQSYVEVRGIIKGSAETLVVRYEVKPRPPVVAMFEHNGNSGSAAEFAKFLHNLQHRRAILSPAKGDS